MSNKRNIIYTVVTSALSWIIFMEIFVFAQFLGHSNDPFGNIWFKIGLFSIPALVIALSLFMIYVFIGVKAEYNRVIAKYDIDFIRENKKREISAIILTIFASFLIFPIFVIFNSYLKSGLSLKQRQYAEKQISVKRVDKFLAQKDVVAFMRRKIKARLIIEDIIAIREEGLDTAFNCNLFILKILRIEKAPYKIIFDEKEVYYIGMNF